MAQTARSAERTLALQVAHVGFLLDRLGQDTGPLQFLRELTQNSIEAIGRTASATGQIVWDVEWGRFDLEGPPLKLCVIDTGDGMTGDEMVRYINQLSSSIAAQSLEGNYGVGAKIAAATRNHAGLIYFSWKDGFGAMIHLWRDPDDGTYGLRQFEMGDRYQHWAPVEDALKPEIIGTHGTMVVLLGNADDDDTMKAPPEAASPSRWIAKYLNTRYFRFPDGIELKAREGWENPRTDTDRNLLRRVMGQQEYLVTHAEASGSVPLSGARAHWWILRDEPALTQNTGYINSSGHVGALFRDELYEVETGRAGAARLQRFGVVFGYQRVVIYLEPEVSKDRVVTTDTARSTLRIGREPLPWHEWEGEFREKLPKEIDELVELYARSAEQGDHEAAIRDRLRQIRDFFRLSRYRPSPTGTAYIDLEGPRRGGRSSESDLSRTDRGKAGGKGGRAGGVYALFVTDRSDTRGESVEVDPFPQVKWVRASDGTRSQGVLEDRAAGYQPDLNLLLINADFRAFRDMVAYWERQYSETPGVGPTIEAAVQEWFQQALTETVMGLRALEGTSPEWTPADIDRALSEEGLTAAVMQRYHIVNSVKRTLGTKLHSLKERTA